MDVEPKPSVFITVDESTTMNSNPYSSPQEPSDTAERPTNSIWHSKITRRICISLGIVWTLMLIAYLPAIVLPPLEYRKPYALLPMKGITSLMTLGVLILIWKVARDWSIAGVIFLSILLCLVQIMICLLGGLMG